MRPSSLLCLLSVLVACGGSSRGGGGASGDAAVSPGDTGGGGPTVDGGVSTRDSAGGGPGLPADCDANARWIYLVDIGQNLLRYEPDAGAITTVGPLGCDVGFGIIPPFSMAVDRSGTAWVLYQDGSLQRVSTEDASCMPSSFAPNQQGFQVFGMGFVSNAAGSSEETLFIAGGPILMMRSRDPDLGMVDMNSLTVSSIGALSGWPELTGTGLGELWGFFPATSPPAVRRLDKSSAAVVEDHALAQLGTGEPTAWAFAFWGARFYLFLENTGDPSTTIWRFDPATDALEPIMTNIGHTVVGAGVSTCAPVELI